MNATLISVVSSTDEGSNGAGSSPGALGFEDSLRRDGMLSSLLTCQTVTQLSKRSVADRHTRAHSARSAHTTHTAHHTHRTPQPTTRGILLKLLLNFQNGARRTGTLLQHGPYLLHDIPLLTEGPRQGLTRCTGRTGRAGLRAGGEIVVVEGGLVVAASGVGVGGERLVGEVLVAGGSPREESKLGLGEIFSSRVTVQRKISRMRHAACAVGASRVTSALLSTAARG